MLVKTNALVAIAASPEAVFYFVASLSNVPKTFRGFCPIPAIIKVEMADGGEMRQGGVSRIKHCDRSVIDEEIITFNKPERQTYRLVKGFEFPISILIESGGGDWNFNSTPKGTQIDWEFYFVLTSPLLYPVGLLLVQVFMQKAIQQCLDNIQELLANQSEDIV
ncbi:SRPBCC family protein [Tychonema sp. LEGE 07199]|uniref:SRPBCC family protein n=1 Tax=unclassified Tychonema TaxID=2642144 RepID=UPI00187F107C|nr:MULTISPECIES: SRPBCC family protein [unclassified Tychonema]MBE9123906.1 SRPBCC family protein [Tychonema sp. LEGE 07199]MBE9130670.1 SRPBCC family protein [Tychonema sp. LEGE 07196]